MAGRPVRRWRDPGHDDRRDSQHTRPTSSTVLVRRRLHEAHRAGTTTIEIKSGYGLNVGRRGEVGRHRPPATRAESTFLGAHLLPAEFDGRADDYIDLVCTDMLAAAAPNAKWIDAFCETGAFDADQCRAVLEAGRAAGLGLRLHGEPTRTRPGRPARRRVRLRVGRPLHLPDRRRHRRARRERHRRDVPPGRRLLHAAAVSRRAAGDRCRRDGRDRVELQPGFELHDVDLVLHRPRRARDAPDRSTRRSPPSPSAAPRRSAAPTSVDCLPAPPATP